MFVNLPKSYSIPVAVHNCTVDCRGYNVKIKINRKVILEVIKAKLIASRKYRRKRGKFDNPTG